MCCERQYVFVLKRWPAVVARSAGALTVWALFVVGTVCCSAEPAASAKDRVRTLAFPDGGFERGGQAIGDLCVEEEHVDQVDLSCLVCGLGVEPQEMHGSKHPRHERLCPRLTKSGREIEVAARVMGHMARPEQTNLVHESVVPVVKNVPEQHCFKKRLLVLGKGK